RNEPSDTFHCATRNAPAAGGKMLSTRGRGVDDTIVRNCHDAVADVCVVESAPTYTAVTRMDWLALPNGVPVRSMRTSKRLLAQVGSADTSSSYGEMNSPRPPAVTVRSAN